MKGMKLVIVESPTKAKTIGKFLGNEFHVTSSFGHIRDLPKSKLGIDVEHGFAPHYVIPTKARKTVTGLKKLAATADTVILATDEDREGEAIAWHLMEALGLSDKKTERIAFHEITKDAIAAALKQPRTLDINLVNAQQARRVLDRIVGYLLSPFLWKKVVRGLSAGRVQSVALRLIADREEEIQQFKAEEYWTLDVDFEKSGSASGKTPFSASLAAIGETPVPKPGIALETDVRAIAKHIEQGVNTVSGVDRKVMKRNPLPPFTTSTLQQESNKRLRMSARQTMRSAQNLYENGFITYMRTDSVNLSRESVDAARAFIQKEFGDSYLLPEPRFFKTKSRLAQEAHEAIRPTDPYRTPESLPGEFSGPERKVYDLIWKRFMASQLPQAQFNTVSVSITSVHNKDSYLLRANGITLAFDGFLKVWPQKLEERVLPELSEGDALRAAETHPEQHFTEPPPRYNEASLIKALEAFGIGRPSTYAPIISVIQLRNYVQKNEARRFEPTEIGTIVSKLLKEHFPEIVDIQFTARLEEELDAIAEGKLQWSSAIADFYGPFSKNLEQKYEEVKKDVLVQEEKTDEVCEKCGKPMVIKTGRFGKFLACSGFPECKNAKSLKTPAEDLGPCPKCGTGAIVKKRTKNRRMFYGCSRYPECDFASWKKPESEQAKED